MIRRILSIAALFFLNSYTLAEPFGFLPMRQDSGVPGTGLEDVTQSLDRMAREVEELRARIDRSQFDLEALLEEIGYEAKDIIRFVKEDIAFEQYPGLLRGAQGTLMNRAGNALDQSVLLATLLKDVGFEARIARGTLNPDQAQLLLSWMHRPRKSVPSALKGGDELEPPSESDIDQAMDEEENPALKYLSRGYREQALRQVKEVSEFLAAKLQEAGLYEGDPGLIQAWAKEAQDYFWVEHRLGPSEAWNAVHPVAGVSDSFPNPNPVQYFVAEIPPSLQHRIRFQVFIEQKFGETLLTHEITPAWERPAANLTGRTLSYTNHPSGLTNVNDFVNLDRTLEQTHVFIPVFDGSVVRDGYGFDVNGIPFRLDSLGMDRFGATALFQKVGGRFEQAAAALGNLSGDRKDEDLSALVTLTAQWIDYTLISPAGTETRFRKYLMDRIGVENRESGRLLPQGTEDEIKPALLLRHDFLVMPGRLCASFYLDQLTESLLDSFRAFRSAPEDQDGGQFLKEFVENPRNARPQNLLRTAYAFDALPAAEVQSGAYRSEPGLIAYQAGLGGLGASQFLTEIVDIVHNRRRGIGHQNLSGPGLVMQAGIWETMVEGVAIESGGSQVFNTFTSFEGLSGDRVAVIGPSDSAALKALGLSTEDEYHVRTDLERGYVVVAPKRSEVHPFTSWWRIDPRSGETLGRISGGRGGQKLVEYTILLMTLNVIALALLFRCHDLASRGNYNRNQVCCWKGESAKALRKFAVIIKFRDAVFYLDKVIGDAARCGAPLPSGPPPPTRP